MKGQAIAIPRYHSGVKFRTALFVTGLTLAIAPTFAAENLASLTKERRAVLERITPEGLSAHVSFLASDALEGRGTPSRGLNVAAEYIASEFRRAGLQPAVNGSFFQTSTFKGRGATTEETVQNVVGILPGTDPKLKDTYLLVTAHYDHLGIRGTVSETNPDIIFNGANDDASGTSGVIEIANALKGYKPKRTIVFMTFWGEEMGLVGSRYYGQHPIFPVEKTVGMVNLEQIGRTDDTEGPRVGAFNVTGYDFSDLTKTLEAAGKEAGVKVEKHPQYSDPYFFASDNAALALVGVPAHTISVAYEFPDYHKVGDSWEKLDYANMAKVVKAIALGVTALADSPKEPAWDAANPKAKRYYDAWKKSHGG